MPRLCSRVFSGVINRGVNFFAICSLLRPNLICLKSCYSLEYLEDEGGGVNWEGGWNIDLIEVG